MASRRLIRTEWTMIFSFFSKHEIFTFHIERKIGEMYLLPTDIIPIVNKALGKVVFLIRIQKEIYFRTWLVSRKLKASYRKSTS